MNALVMGVCRGLADMLRLVVIVHPDVNDMHEVTAFVASMSDTAASQAGYARLRAAISTKVNSAILAELNFQARPGRFGLCLCAERVFVKMTKSPILALETGCSYRVSAILAQTILGLVTSTAWCIRLEGCLKIAICLLLGS